MTAQRATLGVATILVGLAAGFFFTYEASITLGLGQVGDVTYVETFQALNDTIRNPAFGLVFFGSAVALAAAAAAAWGTASVRRKFLLGTALLLYVAGMLITIAGNVPLNRDLADVTDLSPAIAAVARDDFEGPWNLLNLLRTLAIGASFVLITALRAGIMGSSVEGTSGQPMNETASA